MTTIAEGLNEGEREDERGQSKEDIDVGDNGINAKEIVYGRSWEDWIGVLVSIGK